MEKANLIYWDSNYLHFVRYFSIANRDDNSNKILNSIYSDDESPNL